MCTRGQKTQELVALAREGNDAARSEICRVYGERVRWMVRGRMGKELRSKFESIDLVQDTLIQALRRLSQFTYTDEGDFVRWLATIAENELRDNLRKLRAGKRDVRRDVRLEDCRSTTGCGYVGIPGLMRTTTPSIIASRQEDLAILEQAIDQLKPEYRDVIVWIKIEGLSCEEIGHRVGKSADAVRMLATRAMAALTTAFQRVS